MEYWILATSIVIFTFLGFKLCNRKNQFKICKIPEISSFYSFIVAFILRKSSNAISREIYNFKKDAKYIILNMLFTPIVIIRDLELIKSVLVKNFDHFAHHKTFTKETNDPLFAKNLAFTNGNKWREVRNLLSPAFTASKLRAMHVLMSNCAENFTQTFIEQYADKEEIDMKDIFSRYANDVIATCAFGIEIDSLKNPKNEFFIRGSKCTQFAGITIIKLLCLQAFPYLSDKLGLRIISKEHTDFFVNVIKETIKARDEQGITRPDMLQLMMDARGKTSGEIKLDIMDMTAQAFIFFLGGFDTTSNNMCLIAHELATHPDIQLRLQAEIDNVMKETHGKPSYEDVNNMVYLDAVFSEILRIHSFSSISRVCSKEFELPPTLPSSSPYMVKPGMEVIIPISGIHYDPNYYQDPEKFDPDRYLGKKLVVSDVINLGFGLGPRMCIGNRFAILETKVLLVQLLSKCSLVQCKKTPIPFQYDPSNFAPFAKGGFWLKIDCKN